MGMPFAYRVRAVGRGEPPPPPPFKRFPGWGVYLCGAAPPSGRRVALRSDGGATGGLGGWALAAQTTFAAHMPPVVHKSMSVSRVGHMVHAVDTPGGVGGLQWVLTLVPLLISRVRGQRGEVPGAC